MTNRRAPPGSFLVALLGGIAGLLLGLVLWGLVWLARDGSRTPDDALRHIGAVGPLAPSIAPFSLGLAFLGFVVVGAAVGNRLVMMALRSAGKVVVIALGGVAGTALAFLAYIILWVIQHSGDTLGQAVESAVVALDNGSDAVSAFLLAGFFAGLVGTTHAVGRGMGRPTIKVVVSGLIGGLAGLAIYCVAYVIVFRTAVPSDAYVRLFVAAIYSATPSEFLFVGVAASAGVLLSRYSWRLYGILTFVSLLFVVLGYTMYTMTWTLPAVPPDHRAFSLLLFFAEVLSLFMVLLYSFYTIDVAARKHWRRTIDEAPFSPYYLPKVAIHVPTFNEQPELVQSTLRHLMALDYPRDRFLIMVGDDSTQPERAEPLRAFCAQYGIFYLHREDRRGFKAGALNALLEMTPADANLVAVIDADYEVKPEYLSQVAGYFVDPDLGWLQTPQDYRNRHASFLTEQYYLADAYFYRTILPSRNEENSIIFCGTMGILRKRAVLEVGGWGEKYITEDAELSARLLNAGWKSLYVNKTFGYGLIPTSFEAFKRQQYRWAFGGGRILRGHAMRFLFGRFTLRQRLDYLVGTINWFEGAFIFAIALFVLAMGLSDLFGADIASHHANEILLVGLVPIFLLVDGLTRVHLVLRRSVNLGFGGTLRMLGMWFSVKFSNARAAIMGLAGPNIPFVRTPRRSSLNMDRLQALTHAIRLTKFESFMAVVLFATALGVAIKVAFTFGNAGSTGRIFMAFWLLYYTLVFVAAPLYAYKSLTTQRPDDGIDATPPPARAPARLPDVQTPRPRLHADLQFAESLPSSSTATPANAAPSHSASSSSSSLKADLAFDEIPSRT